MRIVVVTGLSGAGKSTALRALEDLDYFCVDNLPLPLLARLIDLLVEQDKDKVALVVDARQGPLLASYKEQCAALRASGHPVEVLFLDAADDLLVRRFSETRRRHPLAGGPRPAPPAGGAEPKAEPRLATELRTGIIAERRVLQPLREDAEAIVDTGNLNVHQLKGIIQERYGRTGGELSVTLLSFGFKHGLPAEADVVLDVRFMPNPYFVEGLSAQTGQSKDVARFVLDSEDAREYLAKTTDWLAASLPRFHREGKAYLTIAVGCTGGRHRSVAVVEELARRLEGKWPLVLRHRDLERRDT